MDQITKNRLEKACQEFADAIDPVKVYELVSSIHPEQKPCRVFDEWKKGSYNVCIPVAFQGDEEKWVVRIPLLPRLAFPEEKMRSEIATMKYVSEKTTIPIPRIHGYSLTSDNILGLPYLLLEYIEGNSLHGTRIREFERPKREHIYGQISNIYIQLYRQQFDRVGALTLDDNGDWVFTNNRPLTIDINEQELSGLDFCRHLPPDRTFDSTIDYIYMILQLISNDFYRGRDCIIDEHDARLYLYSIFSCQSILMEWVKPEYNSGPFVLMHGDLRPPNIIVDDNLNIVSILDWEWSHTVPVQLFTPPYWLSDEGIQQITKDISSLAYLCGAYEFVRSAKHYENRFHNPDKLLFADLPLAKVWAALKGSNEFIIPLGLLAPHCFSNIYWDALDADYYGRDSKERVKTYFELRPDHQKAIEVKMTEFGSFEKEREELGIDKRYMITPKSPEELDQLAKALKEFREGRDKEKGPQQTILSSLCGLLKLHTPDLMSSAFINNLGQKVVARWLLVGFAATATTYIISQRLKK